MSRKQEICRDFQRGNCRYGARCKYLHQLPQQQQQRPQQQQQQQRNDFRGGGNYYSALGNNANNSNQRQPQNQNQQPKEHRCNDLRICKDQIKEDFANEFPSFWRLTCYAHYKFLPNDIVGDVSPEELRALAYDGAKQGLSLTDVAQREASMVAAKSAEFDALLRNPYKGPAAQNSTGFQSSSFTASPFLSPPQKTGTFMPFGQPANLSTNSPAQVFPQTPFGVTTPNSFNFGQPSVDVQFGKQPSNISNENPSPFGQQPNLFQQNPFGGVAAPSPASQNPIPNLQSPNMAMNTNAFASPLFSPVTTQAVFPVNQSSPSFRSPFDSPASFHTPQGASPALNIPAPVSQTVPSTSAPQAVPQNVQEDALWLKDAWKIGEIPEGEPPPQVRF